MLSQHFWKKYFSVYDTLNLVIPYKELMFELERTANPQAGEKILDVGVGTGNLAVLLQKKKAEVTGLDFSSEALEIFKKKCPEAAAVLANLTEPLRMEDETYDKIVSNNTLYNIPPDLRVAVAQELKRVLKFGGKIVLANIAQNFSPARIYRVHLAESWRRHGALATIGTALKMLLPTLRMFYYNFLIKKEYKGRKNELFTFDGQKEILKEAGFVDISDTQTVYAGQGILNFAFKQKK